MGFFLGDVKTWYLLAISMVLFGSSMPQLGRTQYFLGAVVLILNRMICSVGFVNRIYDETAVQNGPGKF